MKNETVKLRVSTQEKQKLQVVQKMLKKKNMSATLVHLVNLAHHRLTE